MFKKYWVGQKVHPGFFPVTSSGAGRGESLNELFCQPNTFTHRFENRKFWLTLNYSQHSGDLFLFDNICKCSYKEVIKLKIILL